MRAIGYTALRRSQRHNCSRLLVPVWHALACILIQQGQFTTWALAGLVSFQLVGVFPAVCATGSTAPGRREFGCLFGGARSLASQDRTAAGLADPHQSRDRPTEQLPARKFSELAPTECGSDSSWYSMH